MFYEGVWLKSGTKELQWPTLQWELNFVNAHTVTVGTEGSRLLPMTFDARLVSLDPPIREITAFKGKSRGDVFIETLIYITPHINEPEFSLPAKIG